MPQVLEDLAYGGDPRQVLDLYLPEGSAPRLFVFIHGGGWRGGDKKHYRALGELFSGFGYAVALPNHRLAPEHPYPAAAEDVAAAIRCVLRYAGESGIRSDGILLGGHSSGAHLAALLAVHPGFLRESTIVGAICISGVYELAAYAAATEYLGPVFGADTAVWNDASPLHHLKKRLPPPFFLAYAEQDFPGAGTQAETMAAGVRSAGGQAKVVMVPGRNHVTILTGVESILDPLAVGLAMFLGGQP